MDNKQRITNWLENDNVWLTKMRDIIQAKGKKCVIEKNGKKEALFYTEGYYKDNSWISLNKVQEAFMFRELFKSAVKTAIKIPYEAVKISAQVAKVSYDSAGELANKVIDLIPESSNESKNKDDK